MARPLLSGRPLSHLPGGHPRARSRKPLRQDLRSSRSVAMSSMTSSRTSAGERVVVFLGPSLDTEVALGILDADYRPPARKGDFYRLLGSDVETVVLIDGVFHGE